MWLTELWLYTTTGSDVPDASDRSEVVMRVGFLEEQHGWREWTFLLDRLGHHERATDRTELHRLVFGPDDAGRSDAGPWLGNTTSIEAARAEMARLLVTIEYGSPDRWSLRHYALVAQVTYQTGIPTDDREHRGASVISAKTLLAHGEDLGPGSRGVHDHRDIDLSAEPEAGRSLLVLTPNAGRFVIATTDRVVASHQ